MPSRYLCPACKRKTGVPILYGHPTDDGFRGAERGEIVIGGCMEEPGDPDRACTACGKQWRARSKRGMRESPRQPR